MAPSLTTESPSAFHPDIRNCRSVYVHNSHGGRYISTVTGSNRNVMLYMSQVGLEQIKVAMVCLSNLHCRRFKDPR